MLPLTFKIYKKMRKKCVVKGLTAYTQHITFSISVSVAEGRIKVTKTVGKAKLYEVK